MHPDFLSYVVLALSVAGLFGVFAEILVKDRSLMPRILRDFREIAAPKGRLRGTNVAFSHQARYA
jgi:hypothetical protein